ncbi:TatD DNase family protein [Porphyromonadaceae bacterium NLAE-zl-C104]|uniref:TatD family hydrolase n=1 Tax=Proteiniphilum sp. TaxID=1926877 RepID=UPI0008E4C87D|nr:TatD family hydrolase [Proteiniphilum sp.]MDY9918524.1 TatD family hydrolase [Proteiniphilum sp.]SFT03220.1 TatD DNase family protein [Porphyromonadaceae bacterium NLAE-zl-C104]
MNLIDTHAHLFVEEFKDDLSEVVIHAKEVGVEKVLLPNIDETSIVHLKQCVLDYPGFFYPMMGLHPTSVTGNWEKQLDIIYRELNSGDYIAVGEIGIDLYWDTSLREVQMHAFEEQLKWSIEKDLPVSIHFRNATEEVIQSIRKVGASSLKGVFHSFGGTKAELEAILELDNFLIGINGVVTFRNSGLSETLKHCPFNRVVLETDSPYLAPVPYRGKRNESAYLLHVITQLAGIWNESQESVARITSRNARELFKLGD